MHFLNLHTSCYIRFERALNQGPIDQMHPEVSDKTSFNAFIAASTSSIDQTLENSMGAINDSKQVEQF